MVTQTEIARRLGVTRMTACRYVKRGCPTTSLKAALEWREANPPAKAIPASKVKQPAPVVEKKAPVKARPKKATKVNPRATENKRVEPEEKPKAKPKPEKRLAPPVLVKTGDSLLDALNGSIMASDYALERFLEAAANTPITAGARLAEYSRALTVRMATETTYRKEQERRNVLVDKGKIMQVCRMAIEAVRRRAQRIPNEVGPQCNPENPLVATKVLEREMAGLMKIAAKEIDGLIVTRRV